MSMVMLLIDADNVSADVIEQAVQRTLADQGAIHVRRAYCNAETALKQQALFKRLSVRPMVNLAAGKNCTDIALAVDAMDLAVTERPDLVVLVSSDSDFAPLVIRLREKGCRVCGIGQQGKTGEDTVAVYDSFIDLQHQPASRPAAAKRPARARRTKAEEVAPPAPVLPDDVLRILDAVPELLRGERVELNHAAERLRGAKLLGKSASSPKLFKKFPEHFLLTPEKTPNKVKYVGPAGT
ncbi:NYN domain protein [Variovorax sp. PBL-H6]|uniref:NYN domain-containing protein n=1 Tax=Variovorax sp. PBL-H6 TaxID=434009 RepID=UPI0013175B01|nr:NYN domain-containing protein [Variovorax sp. PBL-H6]VTU17944.1 NYN domain protein [Variovorax sp. PBL-H6]